MSNFYLSRIADSIYAIAKAMNLRTKVEEKKLSLREEYLSHLTPAERLHEDGLPDGWGWVLNEDQQPELVQKPDPRPEPFPADDDIKSS